MAEVLWIEDKKELLRAIVANPRVIVDFTAPSWCTPCQRFAPHFERAAGNEDDVLFIAVDVDKAPWAMIDYGIASVPSVKLFVHGVFEREIKAPVSALQLLADLRS